MKQQENEFRDSKKMFFRIFNGFSSIGVFYIFFGSTFGLPKLSAIPFILLCTAIIISSFLALNIYKKNNNM